MTSSTAHSSVQAQHQHVLQLLRGGDLKAAETLCSQLTTRFPQFHPGWHTASFIALRRGQAGQALRMIQEALIQAPSDPRYLLQQARCLSADRRRDDSIRSATAAEREAMGDAQVLDAVGSFFSSIGEYQRALQAYSAAVSLAPSEALYWFNRGTVRRFLGQISEAEEDYDRAIVLRPDDYEAYSNRSDLRKQTSDRNHVATMEQLLIAGIREWRGEVQIRYALAKEYEDLGRYPESWRHLVNGARLRRAHLNYDIQRDLDTVDWIIKAFPHAPGEPIAGCNSPEPIFIVGLPRSGTTLVERILGSHSEVHAAGELNHFAAALVSAITLKSGAQALSRQERVAASREVDFAALGEDYLMRTQSVRRLRLHFTDKMPLNYLYCGVIRRALPNARIIHVTRHPMASCYAMFKTLFRDGYPFSYDLAEIAQFYAGYRRLMDHWRQTMPGVIHEIRYEQLIRDQEGETRNLLAACGLRWEETCLQFHLNPTATTSASASQVRRPLYDSSLAQWRFYDDQLQDLRSQLLGAGIAPDELNPE